MKFKQVVTVISTNFDLEPVLEAYIKTYPEGDMLNYRVVFKTEGEHHPDSRSYVIISEYRTPRSGLNLNEYLRSYCNVHDLAAVAHPLLGIMPDITKGQGTRLGRVLPPHTGTE